MGKSKRSDKELTREQRLRHENQSLKREIARLSKRLARLDLDPYDSVKDAIDEHCQQDGFQSGQDLLDRMKKEWKCREPECLGYLEITLFNKINTTWYYRRCNCCNNRTQSQKYDPKEVKGIIKKTD